MEIKFENVSFIIDKGTELEKTVLNSINFEINEVGIYGFLGNSNSGKTCVAELIDALIKPTHGRVIINDYINDGRNIKNINNLRHDIAYVYKNPYEMFFNKTVKKEIEYGMKYFKYKLEKLEMRAMDSLKLVGLDGEYLNYNVFDLSLGDAKKVALASTLTYNPKIIILDEPTIGLNTKEKRELSKLLKIMKDKYNKTILVMSKDTEFLYALANHVFLLDKSKLIVEGKDIFSETVLLSTLGLKVPTNVRFTELAREKRSKKFKNYKDVKDLVKAVCRDVL